jgi:hypothetical protein
MAVVICANELELAIFTYLADSGARGRAGYEAEVNGVVETRTQVVILQESKLDVTNFAKLIKAYFEKQPRHYSMELEPALFNVTGGSIGV